MTNSLVQKIRKYQDVLKSDRLYVVDVETTLISKEKYKTVYNTPPEYVCHGYLGIEVTYPGIRWNLNELLLSVSTPRQDRIFIGHNITYDLHVAYSHRHTNRFQVGSFIWDTMLAEYLLTDQQEKMPSLERCCERYGIAMRKDEEVAQAMQAGICPSKIDKDKLEEYLKGDLLMTKEVFLKQRELFYQRPPEWQVMFINQMFFLVNTLRASCNGMKIDKGFVADNKHDLKITANFLLDDLMEFMGTKTGTPDVIWNPASNSDLSVFLYGGTKKWEERVPNGVYKTGIKAGQTKYKIERKAIESWGNFFDRGSVDEAALKDCIKAIDRTGKHLEYKDFLTKLIEYKDVNKNLNTYFEGYMNHATDDDFIKPKYNHGLTPTGRLTCSGPNLQNIKG